MDRRIEYLEKVCELLKASLYSEKITLKMIAEDPSCKIVQNMILIIKASDCFDDYDDSFKIVEYIRGKYNQIR